MKAIISSLALLLSTACTVQKGYMLSTVGTLVGIDISVDAKNNIPHLRLGYIRWQEYWIPTGKADGDGLASDVPALLSELTLGSKINNGLLIGADIHEKYTTGSSTSGDAAKALFAPRVLTLQPTK